MLQSVMWKEYYRNSSARRGISTILKGEEVGHEFRGNQWTEGQGEGREPSGGSRQKVDWDGLKGPREINRALKENYKISRCTDGLKGEYARKVGQTLDRICEKSPGLQDLLLRKKGLSAIDMDPLSTRVENSISSVAVGSYSQPSGYGGGASIQMAIGGEYGNWAPGQMAPQGSFHPTVGMRASDTFTHELGHHVHLTCMTKPQRERWSGMMDAAIAKEGLTGYESTYLRHNISEYAASRALGFTDDKWERTITYDHDQKYQEAFAESFSKYVSPYYKGDLPKPIHDFIEKTLAPKVKKGVERC
jgi:hypothetical protein